MRDICTSSDRKFGWLPIGSIPENPFRGIYDGNGYKITGLWIHRPNSPGIGLFGFIDQAKISNLTVQNPDIEGNYAVGTPRGRHIGTRRQARQLGASRMHSGRWLCQRANRQRGSGRTYRRGRPQRLSVGRQLL